MAIVDLSKIDGPYHWHPNQGYCVKCGHPVQSWQGAERFVLWCKCSQADFIHLVSQQIHIGCLNHIKKILMKDKMYIWELIEYLGIEIPLT